jgi:hypothetical protein
MQSQILARLRFSEVSAKLASYDAGEILGMSIYLAKFRPLISTPEGQRAVARFNLSPYVDASCRREPDFDCEFPSISAICRGELFAPHLNEGDEVVYITTKDFYGETFRHWRIIARLKVFKRFDSHSDAAAWYRAKIGKVPSNCMVAGNNPLPLNQTSHSSSNCAPGCGSAAAPLKQWNEHYQRRADAIPVFLACKAVWKELSHPPILTDKTAFKILGSWERVRSRLPIKISAPELQAIDMIVRA